MTKCLYNGARHVSIRICCSALLVHRVREASQEPAEQGNLENKPAAGFQEEKEIADKPAVQQEPLPQEDRDQASTHETANAANSSSTEEKQLADAFLADPPKVHAEIPDSVQETSKVDTAEPMQSEAA